MTFVTSKIVRGGLALLLALGIITFGINSFQPVHAMVAVPPTGGGSGSGGSGSGSSGSTTTTPAAPAAPYVTNMIVTVGNGQPPTTGGPTTGYGPSGSEWVTCTSNCQPTGGSMVTVTYNIQFADATPGAFVVCYVYLNGNPTIYSTGSNLSMTFSTNGSSISGFCYAQVGNGPESAQISLP